ncbi:LA2681 family HEPN domain-containing protein [Leptospira kanakyensis]|uniref:LA2681 family HEPN domain-containing protein n=1 Tax=Leptospira kanakyensis TaxID=2484968 RepID=UPI00223CC0E5|nr:LA2681 family HEPN domain-containing protein [Leptospira kanakyensis]MCW7483218.1 LA2681 family HEPN domain-containing protein [Leptospira kanakyensis]
MRNDLKMNKNQELYKIFKNLTKDSISKKITEDEVFKKIGELDTNYSDYNPYLCTVDGVLSNIGFDLSSLKILSFALKRIKNKSHIIPSAKFHYDLGTILYNINLLKTGKEPTFSDLIDAKEYKIASKNFLLVEPTDNDLFLRAKTNYSNILEKYGRNFEAILNYQQALRYDKSFGMAAGNLAIALLYYIKILPSEQKPLTLIYQSIKLLKTALNDKRTAEIGGTHAVQYFKGQLDHIIKFVDEDELKNFKINDYPKTISKYHKFCLEKNIFLNFDFGYYFDKRSITDDLFPIVTENVDEYKPYKNSSLSERTYLVYQIFNQILEDYSSSRLLFYNTSHKSFKNYDRNVNYIYTLDYSQNSHQFGILKKIHASLYNCLDKIAHLVRTYYLSSSSFTSIYFDWFTTDEFKALILEKQSYQLLALFSLSKDFKIGNTYYPIAFKRNRITHSFLNIIDLRPKQEKYEISKVELESDVLDLFHIVKAALLYSIIALTPNPDENYVEMQTFLQKEIY